MKLYVIRHGQSLGNVNQHKTPNDGLTDLGKKQARKVADYFESISVSRIFCSPFRRVVETATPLAVDQEKRITLSPELSEIFDCVKRRDHKWESREELEKQFPFATFAKTDEIKKQWWPNYPETEEVEVKHRVKSFFEKIIIPLLEKDEHVVIFGHRATTAQLKKFLCPDVSYEDHGNAVIFEYTLDENGTCVENKEITEHLEGLV
ncbi:histidine phosphatase family protein [Pseudalkalibacillus caeni]|nr:histidine phosphatase family protein [Pseudalkalibacillus caeni]